MYWAAAGTSSDFPNPDRWRRGQAPEPIRDEITPSNIILIGPTGVGKTEIARRLAGAPLVKVEASKFTEVSYVGRDVEGMVRDLNDWTAEIDQSSVNRATRPRHPGGDSS